MSDGPAITKRELAWLDMIRRVSYENGYLAAKLATIEMAAKLKPPPLPPNSVEVEPTSTPENKSP